MPSIRPFRAVARPSIHDLATFLFSPQTPTRCISQLQRVPTAPFRAVSSSRSFSTTRQHYNASPKPQTHDRGPPSQEDTQTDFGSLNVLGNTPAPSTSIDACLWDGFHFNSGVKVTGGRGVLLVGGEAFEWCPWAAKQGKKAGGDQEELRLVNEKGQWDVEDEAWGLLGVVWPKPDLLILGLGKDVRPISPRTRQYLNSLGIRIEIQDTRNAAAQFNLLATERGVSSVAAALVPIGWREGVGVKI